MLPHWGRESRDRQDQSQEILAKRWLDEGATIVAGSHPHVLQPMEKYITADARETFIIYSLGNFTTFHYDFRQKASMVLFLSLEKNAQGEVKINGVKYLPLFIRNRTGNLMDVEVHPIFPDSRFRGNGYAESVDAINHIYEMMGSENAIEEAASDQIEFSHCHRQELF